LSRENTDNDFEIESKGKQSYYPPIDSEAKNWGLHVTTVGESEVEGHSDYPAQDHPETHQFNLTQGRVLDEYGFVLITKGHGLFRDSTKEASVASGSIIWIYPGQWHSYRPDTTHGWKEQWVCFNGNYADHLVHEIGLEKESHVMNEMITPPLLEMMQRLLELFATQPLGYHQQAAATLTQILAWVYSERKKNSVGGSASEEIMTKAKMMISEQVKTDIHMEDLAKELSVSYSWFRKTFREATGFSPKSYHTECRMNMAKNLLSSTSLSVSDISDEMGYSSPFHFSNVFSQKIGCRPKKWRMDPHKK
jgi:AraC-like DNA-binding protein